MSSQLNPWGLLEFQGDFDHPAPSAVTAAEELWRLARPHELHIPTLLAQIIDDKTLDALNAYYTGTLSAVSYQPSAKIVATAEPSLASPGTDSKGTGGKVNSY